MAALQHALAGFVTISLPEMDAVALQSRMDTKYLLSVHRLPALLHELAKEYRLLEVGGQRGGLYRTLYFDTPGLQAYYDHHNGRTFRCKVRLREYTSSGACFLEVKNRNGRGGTEKRRIPAPAMAATLTPGQRAFVASACDLGPDLVPALWNEFTRYTLVHAERIERITLDTGLFFYMEGREARLNGVCVAELKEGRTGHGSPFAALMRALPSPPMNFSKYCMGTVLLRPGVKYNQFKPALLRAERLAAAA